MQKKCWHQMLLVFRVGRDFFQIAGRGRDGLPRKAQIYTGLRTACDLDP